MYKILKRLLDILIALLALVIFLPVFITVIIILAFSSENEVFYFQKRVGYKNALFNIWKFATMQKNSPDIGTGEITLRNDPRVTTIGRFLRKTKINELPQIVNVLKGEMSIVGPRPLMPVSFNLYSQQVQNVIYNSKPGITGIGSLIFREEEKILSDAVDPRLMYSAIYLYKGQLEIWYQQHSSIYTNVMIILLTGLSILFPSGNFTCRVFKNLPIRTF